MTEKPANPNVLYMESNWCYLVRLLATQLQQAMLSKSQLAYKPRAGVGHPHEAAMINVKLANDQVVNGRGYLQVAPG